MTTVFADTFLWLAIVHPNDAWHDRAVQYLDQFTGKLVTTEWVLVEVGDALAGSAQGRAEYISLRADLITDPEVVIVASTAELFEAGNRLYGARPDKEWSLTDCLSIVVMHRHGLTEALTGDRHFEQAGFVALLK